MKFLFVLTLILSINSIQWYEQGNPHMLRGTEFNQTVKDPTHCKFIKFFTPWCRYCRVLKDLIDNYKQTTYANSTQVKFYDVNCHESPDICMPFKIYSVPLIMIIDRDGVTKQTATGVYPKEWYEGVINSNCGVSKKEVGEKEVRKQGAGEKKEEKEVVKKGLTREEPVKTVNQTKQEERNSKNVDENNVKPAQNNQVIQQKVEKQKQAQVAAATDSAQHFAAAENVESGKEQAALKKGGAHNNQTKIEEVAEAPSPTAVHKGQSLQTFILLALAFVVCFFLHNKFCNQKRNQPI